MSAAANGAVSPNSTRFTETASEIVPAAPAELLLQRVISTPGVGAEAGGTDDRHEGDAGDQPSAVDLVRSSGGRGRTARRGRRHGSPSCATIVIEGQWPERHYVKESGHVRHQVAVLVLHGVAAFDLGTPGQILGAARSNTGERALCGTDLYGRRRTGAVVGRVHSVARPWTGDPGRRGHGHHSRVHGDLMRDGVPELTEAEVAALQRIPATARLVSICTAAFALALVGKLDGRPATTHWAYADRFRSHVS